MQAIQSTQMQLQALIESTARDRDRRLMLERLYSDKLKEPLPVNADRALAAHRATRRPRRCRLSQQLTLARGDARRSWSCG